MITPGAATAALLDAIGRLTDVIETENIALAAGGRQAVRPLLDDKRAACRAYEEAVRKLSDTAGTDAASAVAVQRAVERLGRASEENRRRLAAAIAAHKRLLDAIAAAVRELAPTARAYTRSGTARPSAGVSLAPPAVSIDRTL